MMHAIKSGWVGQTFALTTRNESGGRKARIRRSKEERKAMAESFIKKYQNSNNGDFPSLNLTHKEVGGSFYTVREIVREIIQENRVLGPAKLLSEEQNYENLLEHYPLGSISIDPQTCFSPSDETRIISHIASNQNQNSSEKLVENSNGQLYRSEHQKFNSEQVANDVVESVKDNIESVERCRTESAFHPYEGEQIPELSGQFPIPDCQKFDNEVTVKGSQSIDEDEESYGPILSSSVSIHHLKTIQEHHQETSEEQVLHSGRDFPGHGHRRSNSEDAVSGITQAVEKNDQYGLPVSSTAVGEASLDVQKGRSKRVEASNAGRTSFNAGIVVEKFPLRPVAKKIDVVEGRSEEQGPVTRTLDVNGIEQDGVHVLEDSSSLMNKEVGADLADPSLKKLEPVDQIASINVGNPSVDSSKHSTNEETLVLQINNVAELGAKVSSPVEAKPVNAPTGLNENVNNINTTDSHFKPEETTGANDKSNIEQSRSSKKGSNSTLDRINLETWEGTSEKPGRPETNPLLALFNAFVTAFVKFWTE